ncbi:MAG: haloalkane dehalogenase [Myxococcota bacterium]
MEVLRTPDECFENLSAFDFDPHYTEVPDFEGGTLRIHHLDEGSPDAPAVLCMHGQPTWSYLYRHMIPLLTGAGLRVIAPDLVGYGRSDKPAAREDYSYQRQVDWMSAWLTANDFSGLTFFGQDWGGLIGLRLVAENEARFAKVVISNTGLPVPEGVSQEVCDKVRRFRAEAPTPTLAEVGAAMAKMSTGEMALHFAYWQKWCWESEDMPVGVAVTGSIRGRALSAAETAAYDAPFPSASFKMGPRAMPSQVPTLPDDPSVEANRHAWAVFEKWQKPFLTAFADNDPVTKGMGPAFIARVPGAAGQPHTTLEGAGHFVQEDCPEALAKIIADFVKG